MPVFAASDVARLRKSLLETGCCCSSDEVFTASSLSFMVDYPGGHESWRPPKICACR